MSYGQFLYYVFRVLPSSVGLKFPLLGLRIILINSIAMYSNLSCLFLFIIKLSTAVIIPGPCPIPKLPLVPNEFFSERSIWLLDFHLPSSPRAENPLFHPLLATQRQRVEFTSPVMFVGNLIAVKCLNLVGNLTLNTSMDCYSYSYKVQSNANIGLTGKSPPCFRDHTFVANMKILKINQTVILWMCENIRDSQHEQALMILSSGDSYYNLTLLLELVNLSNDQWILLKSFPVSSTDEGVSHCVQYDCPNVITWMKHLLVAIVIIFLCMFYIGLSRLIQ